MNKSILNTGIQDFIKNFSSNDILSVLLKKPFFKEVTNKELVEQIESRNKCREKLPLWFNNQLIYYPPKRSIEQSSSEITAAYKGTLVTGKKLIDLTGGMGVDSYFLSKSVGHLIYCEKDASLAQIAEHNFKVMGAENISVYPGDGLKFLGQEKSFYDWVYLDPSRRTGSKSRVFLLEEAEPALPESLQIIWPFTTHILIKTSPLIDLRYGIQNLSNVRKIHVLAVNNEVKELLWELEKDYEGDTTIQTVNFSKREEQTFNFSLEEESQASAFYSTVGRYLYEPNAALLKAGAFKIISEKFRLNKLHEHSHLYTDDKLIHFPGRRFLVQRMMIYRPNDLNNAGIKKANISTRNFPLTVQELRKRHGISDGGDLYLFFTKQAPDTLVVLFCEKH